jgi:AraC-like DNA-binding protein
LQKTAIIKRVPAHYVEHPVHPSLQDAVVCTWIDRSAEVRHPVLPDSCIDIVWNGQQLSVAGPDTGPVEVPPGPTFVGIRFKPGAAPGFLGVAASDLVDRTVSLREVWGREAAELAERLAEAASSSAERLLEDAVRTKHDPRHVDPLVGEMLRRLSRGHGRVAHIKSLAQRLDVSERTLRRRCISQIGYGPKTLERVLRFRRALRLMQSSVPLIDTAQLAGYVDQAHLTNEFQRLAGTPPGRMSRLSDLLISSNGYP